LIEQGDEPDIDVCDIDVRDGWSPVICTTALRRH
jgi:hypothetical protein